MSNKVSFKPHWIIEGRYNSRRSNRKMKALNILIIIALLLTVVILGINHANLKYDYDKVNITISKLQKDNDTNQIALSTQKLELSNTRDKISTLESDLTHYKDKIKAYEDTYGKINSFSLKSLMNNANSKNPTWKELCTFLFKDQTNTYRYIDNVFMCGNFAEAIHNNAEKAGIKSAYVRIEFTDGLYDHALNAFITTDKGLVFIDCTGSSKGTGSDKVAYISKGKEVGLLELTSQTYVFIKPNDYSFYQTATYEMGKKYYSYGIVKDIGVNW